MSKELEEREEKLAALRAALDDGEASGVATPFDFAACNFPHVRLAGGKVVVWPKHGDYKLEDFLARAGDGWARSQWDERTPVHVGSDKVHLKVAFSRWRADGSLIGRFETIYIVTLQDGHWGIQARSSFAS